MCHFLSTVHQLFINLFINFLSTFHQLCVSTLYQLFINFINLLSTVYQLFINFINFWTTVYQLFIILIELMNAHCLSPVCAECLAFKGATAGASRCRAPPPSMVAATTKDYGCIWKDCLGTQPRSSKADNLWGDIKHYIKHPSPPATGFWAPVAPWHQAYTEG